MTFISNSHFIHLNHSPWHPCLTSYIVIQKKKLHIHPKVAVDYSEDPQKKESINISSQKIRYSSLARFGGVTLFLIYLGYISSKIQVEKVDSEEFLTQQNNSNTNGLVSCPPKKIGYTFSKNQVDRQIRRSYSLFSIYLGYTSSKIQVDKVDSEEFPTLQQYTKRIRASVLKKI